MTLACKLIECYPGFGPDLTTDGNMEDAPATNWTAGGGATRAADTVTFHGGCQSLRVTAAGGALGYAYQDVTVEAGHRYRIGVWGYATAGDVWQIRIYAGGTVRWTSGTHNAVAWAEEVKFYRVPDGITTIRIWLQAVNNGDIIYFDDVTVKREAPVPMTEINLFYRPDVGWGGLEKALKPYDPERRELWGGYLDDQLVRQEDGKRVIPLELHGQWTADGAKPAPDVLIDAVNALEEMLRHAARFRKDGWGGEVFLEFRLHTATHAIWYPVCSGIVDKSDLMTACGAMTGGVYSVPKAAIEVGVIVVCEAYWESPFTYDLANLLNNPGFEEWNSAGPSPICDNQPDGWTDQESPPGVTGTNNQETDEVSEGCEALRIEVAAINNGEYKGVYQVITARLQADTQYTLLAWVQNAAITNGNINIRVWGSDSGDLGTALDSGAANAVYTIYSCQFTPTAADIAGTVLVYARILATANGCSGIVHIDKMLVMESSNVPTGWMSSSYLMNHYDRDPNDINFLSVCDVPGEVEAEAKYTIDLGNSAAYLRTAKRTRDDPCDFIWQLLPVNAGFVGCTDGALCAAPHDATAPGGHRVEVTFGTKTLQLRCYWDINTDLTSYYGKFRLLLIARMEGLTDTATIRVMATDVAPWLGYVQERDVSGASWTLYDGWEILSYRIGSADNDLLATGNTFRISIYASTDAPGAATDDLYIAGVYLVPLDEAFLVCGGPTFAATANLIIKNMDGDKGLFPYAGAADAYYPNLGAVGTYPLLEPSIENWLYFVLTAGAEVWTLGDMYSVSLTYRPRGIFLRGANP